MLPRARLATSQISVPAHTHGVLGYHDGYSVAGVLVSDSQQQDWREEGYEDNGEETCQGLTIATTLDINYFKK